MAFSKAQRQTAILAAILGAILLVLAFFYRDQFIPQPETQPSSAAVARLVIPASDVNALTTRDDFRALKRFGVIPVQPALGQGNPAPFLTKPGAP